jgi:hypothetical protein
LHGAYPLSYIVRREAEGERSEGIALGSAELMLCLRNGPKGVEVGGPADALRQQKRQREEGKEFFID